ncbi:helix-turn-helix transcriptional regulator, partial [Mycobacterium sp. RTGN3]|uniref:helix-turn-helix domain-containing protein n=1 Tax=Mycobacterium sp. RTGN3 TaxID=3016524 RepID=UPI0029C64396
MTSAIEVADPAKRSNVLIGAEVHRLMWVGRRTQAQLAEMLGVDQGSVSKRLRGKTEWAAWEVAVTAAWLGVEPADLIPPIDLHPDDGGDDDGGSSAPTRARTWDLRI